MTPLTSPFGPISARMAELDSLVRRLGGAFEGVPTSLDLRMDIEEDDRQYTVSIDIPGVRKNDIDVTVSGNAVTVRACTDHAESISGNGGRGKKLYSERVLGEAVRSFTLPAEVDAMHTTANYEHGVLLLTLPKLSGSQSRHIKVS
ncbi:MAG: Hsp20/alpha crystallin family protein [Pseudomonadota bacterium]